MKKALLSLKETNNLSFYCASLIFLSLANNGFCKLPKSEAYPAKKLEESVDKDKLKMRFKEVTDGLTVENVQDKVDQIAHYLNKDKLKKGVDESANRIRELIDYAEEHLSKEKIKEMVALFADAVDKDKLKEAFDQFVASIDQERLQETLKHSLSQAAESLQDVTHALEKELQSIENNAEAIYHKVHDYNWNQWLKLRSSDGPATLSDFKLGNQGKVAIVRPGEQIEGEVVCSFNRDQCSALSLYRVVLGIKNKGGQTSIFNHFGMRAGEEKDHFTLTAPLEKGIYQVGFRVLESARAETAIKCWDEPNEFGGGEPVTLGLLIVV